MATHRRDTASAPSRRTMLTLSALAIGSVGSTTITGCARPRDIEVTGQVQAARATAYREIAQAAIPAVENVWGTGTVSLPIRLHLPATTSQWALATGHPVSERGYAGTVVQRQGATSPRIVIHPDVWEALTKQGRSAVVTHEISHLAMGAPRKAPWWLTEGLAEYTAHRDSRLTVPQIAGSALTRAVANPPSGWPRPHPDGDPWQNYGQAWLACVFLAAEVGETRLLTSYSAARVESQWDVVSRAVLGKPAHALHRNWVRWLAQQ